MDNFSLDKCLVNCYYGYMKCILCKKEFPANELHIHYYHKDGAVWEFETDKDFLVAIDTSRECLEKCDYNKMNKSEICEHSWTEEHTNCTKCGESRITITGNSLPKGAFRIDSPDDL